MHDNISNPHIPGIDETLFEKLKEKIHPLFRHNDTGDASELSPKTKRRLQKKQKLRKPSITIQQISEAGGSALNNTLKEHIKEELASYMGLWHFNPR